MHADSTIQNMNGTSGPIADIRKNSSLVLDNCVLSTNSNLEPEENGGAAIRIQDFLASQPCAVQVIHPLLLCCCCCVASLKNLRSDTGCESLGFLLLHCL